MKYEYDIAVIWSGPWWLTVAIWMGVMEKKVCLIEKAHIGWDCTNYGCVPSKAMLYYAKTHEAEDDALVAWLTYARAHREEIREEETPEILASYWVETRFGFGSLKDKHTILITQDDWLTETVTAKRIILCTWSKARVMDIKGVDKEDILTNEELFEVDYPIKQLAILWDGIIACEMAEALSWLWVKVTILSKHDEILDQYDDEVGTWMHQYLEKQWVTIMTGIKADRVEKRWSLIVVDGVWNEKTIAYDKLLMAIGRVPLIGWMNLDGVGVKTDSGWVIVNTYGKTSVSNIYWVGDCLTNNPRMTHWSNHQGRHMVQNLIAWFGFASPALKKHPVPSVLYTDYEVATVGMNEASAIKKYGRHNLVIRSHSFAKNDRSKLTESTEWFMKVIAKRWTLKIIGVTIVWKNAWEMLPLYVYAVKKWMSLRAISSLIFAYPTRAEIIKWLVDEYLHDVSKDWKSELKWVLKRIFMFRKK